MLKTRADDSRVSQAANRGAAWARPGWVLAAWKEVQRGVLNADINGLAALRIPAAMVGAAPGSQEVPDDQMQTGEDHPSTATYALACVVISPISAAA